MKTAQRVKWSEQYKINPKETVDKAMSYSFIKGSMQQPFTRVEVINMPKIMP